MLINYYVDPANLFNAKYERGIANYLAHGFNVTDVINYDERSLQNYFIKKMPKCPSEIALGASRIMLINSALAHNGNFINNGVSGASLEDILAIYYLYEKKGCKIRKVIFGVEPYLLNDNHNLIGWKSLEQEYKEFSNKLLNKPSPYSFETAFQGYDKYYQLLSISYFRSSLDYFMRGVKVDYRPTQDIANNGFTRLKDGAIYYGALYRKASRDEVEKRAKETFNNRVYSFGEFTRLSEHYKFLFASFIEYLQNKQIEVEFFFTPYHPIVYNFFKGNPDFNMVFKAEDYFLSYATSHQIKIYGSFNPEKYSLDNSYFYDGFHCNPKGIAKILDIDKKTRYAAPNNVSGENLLREHS